MGATALPVVAACHDCLEIVCSAHFLDNNLYLKLNEVCPRWPF